MPTSLALGDLNGDGKPDLTVANKGSNGVSVLLNQGGGTFAAKVDYPTGLQANCVTLGDLDGDGKLDLAVTNYTGDDITVLLNTSH